MDIGTLTPRLAFWSSIGLGAAGVAFPDYREVWFTVAALAFAWCLYIWGKWVFTTYRLVLPLQPRAAGVTTTQRRQFPNEALETISLHHYRNESVEMDGKCFDRCRFDSVTFIFRGFRNFQIINCHFYGTIYFQTNDDPAKAFLSFAAGLIDMANKQSDFEGNWMIGEKDDRGYITISFTEKLNPRAIEKKR